MSQTPGFNNGKIIGNQALIQRSGVGEFVEYNDGTNTFSLYSGNGDPNAVVTADIGSEYKDLSNGDIYTKATSGVSTGWEKLNSGGSYINTVTTDSGAPPVPATANNINIIGGTGIIVTGNGPGDTVTVSVSGSLMTWQEVTAASASMNNNKGYIANRGTQITLTLPTTASQGDIIRIAGKGAGGYTIAQNAGQTIFYVASATTTGVGGSLTPVERYDSIELLCMTANTDWVVLNATGNYTVV